MITCTMFGAKYSSVNMADKTTDGRMMWLKEGPDGRLKQTSDGTGSTKRKSEPETENEPSRKKTEAGSQHMLSGKTGADESQQTPVGSTNCGSSPTLKFGFMNKKNVPSTVEMGPKTTTSMTFKGLAKPKTAPVPVKMNIGVQKPKETPVVKSTVSSKVACVFNADEDSDEEEMPPEARMRMKNIGRNTPTAAGPNSFGKSKMGFCDRQRMIQKELEKEVDS